MGPWSCARSVRLTADENNAEVSTRAQKTRNSRPATGLRTTAPEARSPRCDAPKHVSVTRSGSCSRAVKVFIVLYSCPHCSTLPLGSQVLQGAASNLAHSIGSRLPRLLGAPGRVPQTADRIYPTTSPCVRGKGRKRGYATFREGPMRHPSIGCIHK